MTTTLTFEIELQSDYHSGAGYGIGATIDAALLRDSDGIPVLRGTTVTGLLRDGLHRLLQTQPLRQAYPNNCAVREHRTETNDNTAGYCRHQEQAQNCPLCKLFGSPLHPKRWHFSSARPVVNNKMLPVDAPSSVSNVTADSDITRRARINPRTRRAQENKLFSREVGDSRLRFQFTATCVEPVEIVQDIELLIAAVRMVRHLGASRRRGQGSCRIDLISIEGDQALADQDRQQWLARLKNRLGGKTLPTIHLTRQEFEPASSSTEKTSPHRFWLVMRTEEPLLVAERSEAANQFTARPFIPGPTLRGALANRAAARYPEIRQCEGQAYERFIDLFFRQGLKFTALYPAYQSPKMSQYLYPSLPVPHDLFSCEVYPIQHGVRSYATSIDEIPPCPICTQSEPPLDHDQKSIDGKETFFPLTENLPDKPVSPSRMVEMHITIDPDSGRVNSGDLYGYHALTAGQYFIGEITCTSQQDWQNFQTLTGLPTPDQPFTLRLGKASGRGYGRVTAWLITPPDDRPLWLLQPITRRIQDVTTAFTLTLLSDTIIQDAWGRYAVSFDQKWLKQALGVEVEIIQQFSRTITIDSYNNHLGLPRQQEIALQAGSTVGLRLAESPADPATFLTKLAGLEQAGIGVRRSEGFGRVAFNHTLYEIVANDEYELSEEAQREINLNKLTTATSDPAFPFNEEMEFERNWQTWLNNTHLWKLNRNEPRFAQVSRLLHTAHWIPLDILRQMLNQLGNESQLLGQPLVGRDQPNFFREEGAIGLTWLSEAFDKLQVDLEKQKITALEPATQERLRRRGLIMLADKLAMLAETTRGE